MSSQTFNSQALQLNGNNSMQIGRAGAAAGNTVNAKRATGRIQLNIIDSASSSVDSGSDFEGSGDRFYGPVWLIVGQHRTSGANGLYRSVAQST
jgi:hypothetical protein